MHGSCELKAFLTLGCDSLKVYNVLISRVIKSDKHIKSDCNLHHESMIV